jgi:hypothetical protein
MTRVNKPLLDRTYELLDSTELSVPEVASGAEVGAEWLKKLRSRCIEDPSVNRIQRLHDFLSKGGLGRASNQVGRER